jgi:hypothetical protein
MNSKNELIEKISKYVHNYENPKMKDTNNKKNSSKKTLGKQKNKFISLDFDVLAKQQLFKAENTNQHKEIFDEGKYISLTYQKKFYFKISKLNKILFNN